MHAFQKQHYYPISGSRATGYLGCGFSRAAWYLHLGVHEARVARLVSGRRRDELCDPEQVAQGDAGVVDAHNDEAARSPVSLCQTPPWQLSSMPWTRDARTHRAARALWAISTRWQHESRHTRVAWRAGGNCDCLHLEAGRAPARGAVHVENHGVRPAANTKNVCERPRGLLIAKTPVLMSTGAASCREVSP